MNVQKLRETRLLGVALFDLVLAMIGMILLFILAWYYHFRNMAIWPFIIMAIILTVPIGIFFHVIFGIDTSINRRLGLSN